MNTNTTTIRAEKLSRVYHTSAEDIAAVDGIDLEIHCGEFVALMGPSGSGKTTLLDLLGCLDTPSSGKLTVLGKQVDGLREHQLVAIRRAGISFIFQEFLLVPTLTALENVLLPLCFGKRKPDRPHGEALLKQVGLADRMSHRPSALSGGERQRVAVARALVTRPRLLLADEPTGNLDSTNASAVFDLLHALADDGLTVVAATHDQELGPTATRVIRLRDGRLRVGAREKRILQSAGEVTDTR
jgi:ABC-type lipoprotein export system ATPase subunit